MPGGRRAGRAQHSGPHGPHVARTPQKGSIRAGSAPSQGSLIRPHTQTSPWHAFSPTPLTAGPARRDHAPTTMHMLKARVTPVEHWARCPEFRQPTRDPGCTLTSHPEGPSPDPNNDG